MAKRCRAIHFSATNFSAHPAFTPRTAAGSIEIGNDAVDAVRSQEAIVDALPQAVRVERIAEVLVRVPVVLAKRRGGHAQLVGGLVVIQNFTPTAFVAGTAAVALVDDDQVKEVGGILPVQARTPFVFGDRLID